MQHTITTSADGSSTLQLTQFGETYHSTNGAYTEATHIYIQCGLEHLFRNCGAPQINIFDVGFGTGLNCILAWAWQQQLRQKGHPYPRIVYHGIEKYPIPLSEIEQLNYPNIIAQHTGFLPDNLSETFLFMHKCQWEENVALPEIPTNARLGNKMTSRCAPTHSNTTAGNKMASECAPTTTNTPVGNKIASVCAPTHSNAAAGNKMASGYAPTTTNTPVGNKMTSGCAQADNALSSVEYYREDDFILIKNCADIATLDAGYYRNNHTDFHTDSDTPAVIFYDTFSPATQPELWDEAIFRNIAAGCTTGSVLVTYCSKGTVKQALRNAGFTLERLAGPPGKRHILRGTL